MVDSSYRVSLRPNNKIPNLSEQNKDRDPTKIRQKSESRDINIITGTRIRQPVRTLPRTATAARP